MVDNAEAARRLEALRASRRWVEAFALLRERAAQTTDPELSAGMWFEAGKLALEQLANQAMAVSCFEASLAARPGQREVEDRLRALYENRRCWRELLALARSDDERRELEARIEAKPWWRRLLGG